MSDEQDFDSYQPAAATVAINETKERQYLPVDRYHPIPNQQAVPFADANTRLVLATNDAEVEAAMRSLQVGGGKEEKQEEEEGGAAVAPKASPAIVAVSGGVTLPWNQGDRGRYRKGSFTLLANPPSTRPTLPFRHSFQFDPVVVMYGSIDGNLGNYAWMRKHESTMTSDKLSADDKKMFSKLHTIDPSEAKGDIHTTFGGYCAEKLHPGTLMDKRGYATFVRICHLELIAAWDATQFWEINGKVKENGKEVDGKIKPLEKVAQSRMKKHKLSLKGELSAAERELIQMKLGAMIVLTSGHWKSPLKLQVDASVDRSDTESVLEWENKMDAMVLKCATSEEVVQLLVQQRLGPDGKGRNIALKWLHRYFAQGAFVEYDRFVPKAHIEDENWGPIIATVRQGKVSYIPLPVEFANKHRVSDTLTPSETRFKSGDLIMPFGTIEFYENTVSQGLPYCGLRAVLDGAKILTSNMKTADYGSEDTQSMVAFVHPDAVEEAIPGFEHEEYVVRVEKLIGQEDLAFVQEQVATKSLTKQKHAEKALVTAAKNKAEKAKKSTFNAITHVARVVKPMAALMPPQQQQQQQQEKKQKQDDPMEADASWANDLVPEEVMRSPHVKGAPSSSAAAASSSSAHVPSSPNVRPRVSASKRKPAAEPEQDQEEEKTNKTSRSKDKTGSSRSAKRSKTHAAAGSTVADID
jgi:hypothetical protein